MRDFSGLFDTASVEALLVRYAKALEAVGTPVVNDAQSSHADMDVEEEGQLAHRRGPWELVKAMLGAITAWRQADGQVANVAAWDEAARMVCARRSGTQGELDLPGGGLFAFTRSLSSCCAPAR
jgi:hypothetical protein